MDPASHEVQCNVNLLAWLTAAAALWLLAVNRWVIHWTDSPLKSAALLGSLPVAVGGALLGWWLGKRIGAANVAPWLVIAAMGAGELRRAALRWRAAAWPGRSDRPALLAWRPVTTTDLEVVHHEVRVTALGQGRLRVAHLTDLHVSDALGSAYFERVFAATRASRPDVVLLTGDLLSRPERLDLLQRVIARRLTAPHGVFAVLGNHDYWSDPAGVRRVLQGAGIELLAGRCHRLALAGPAIQVCGTEAPWGPSLDPGALAQAALTIALSHTPDNVYELAQLGVDAVFGGHYHGGQLRLPGLGALLVPSRYGRRFTQGRFHVGGAHLFVSAGVGADSPPLRLYSRPQLLVVDFVGAAPALAAAGSTGEGGGARG